MIKPATVAFDVDGTLIEYDDTPRYDVIAFFKQFEQWGCEMIIWSGGGVDYAKHWAEKLGLEAKIIEKWSIKPDIAIDDFPNGVPWEKPIAKANICVFNKGK